MAIPYYHVDAFTGELFDILKHRHAPARGDHRPFMETFADQFPAFSFA
jgi:hypothetical protein